MSEKDFILVDVREHLQEKNTLVFSCVVGNDNFQEDAVYVDNRKVPVEYHIKEGNDIRRKYLEYRMNISQEIIGKLTLTGSWKEVKKIEFRNEKRNCTDYILKGQQLKKLLGTVAGNQELERIEDGKVILTGWSIAGEDTCFELYADGKKVEKSVKRHYRKDVNDFYEELEPEFKAGYEIETADTGMKQLKLVITAGGKKKIQSISVENVRKGKTGHKTVSMAKKAVAYFKRNGLKRTIRRTKLKLRGQKDCVTYEDFLKKYAVTPEELERQRQEQFEIQPKFSIAVPLYQTNHKYLTELIASVQGQTYGNWELCLADGSGAENNLQQLVEGFQKEDSRIKYRLLEDNLGIAGNTNAALEMAEGDYIVLADHDDLLTEESLYQCVKAINENPKRDVIYSDEDKIDMAGKKLFEPHFKPDFNVDLLCSMNYICHLFVFKRGLLEKTGGFQREYDGAQDHDFIFRCVEQAEEIYHIPKVLYHWRCHMQSTSSNPESKLYAFENGAKAVQAHYDRMGIPAKVEQGRYYGMYRTFYQWKERPLVSIIIPNKDHIEDLRKCIQSIERQAYDNYEILIVENNSTEEETFAYYKEIESEKIHVLFYEGGFNFSKINNFGAEQAKGTYYLLLNNDTEMIGEHCLEELLYPCMREDVGIVGARLYYEDDTVQHAGVIIGFGGMAGHAFIGMDREDNGYFSRSICTQDLSAVTAACMMTKKSVFEEVNGLDEELVVAMNDIDYCLRVRETGKLVIFNPHAELYHYESKSRGLENSAEKVERFNREVAFFTKRWEGILKDGDPYYNPNLTLDRADFSLKM